MSHHRSESSDSSPAEWWCGVVVTGDPCGNLVHNDLLLYQMAALSTFLFDLFFCYLLLLKDCWNPPNRIVGGGGGGASR